ncbi:TPA: YbaB/EbfC family nucleoid-associated protein [Candidatus Bipolaricaulota bacterium]|nr:YbaB/EbfC family nucleoid-associated protein [Candidatus Bipolaricaulota bacterium]
MKGFPGNIQELMRQVKRAQELLAKKQEELAEMKVEASSGGGMVKVVANGQEEILDIKISPEVVDPQDVGMLEDLILAAIREARAKAKELAQREMGGLFGSLGLPNIPIPGLF